MCNKIDEKLLIMYKYLQEHAFSREEVSKVLNITTRQLSRLMKQWESENLLEYQVGIGRGVFSEVTFNKDIEQLYVSYQIQQIGTLSFEEIEHILDLPLYNSSKALIESIYQQRLVAKNDNNQTDEDEATFIDFVYRIPEVLDPLLHSDVSQDVLLFNIMDRLYEVDNKLIFLSSLVSHEEVDDYGLTIYLHHDIKFSNGQILFAQNAVDCLNRLMKHPDHQYKFAMVKSIEVLNLFCFKIYYEGSIDYLKLMLSSAYASIYIQDDNKFLGTGAYKVYSTTENYITIKARTDSHHQTPDVGTVYLINNYEQYTRSFKYQQTEELSKGVVIQNGFMCFNPLFTKLDKKKRQLLIELVTIFYKSFNNNQNVELKPTEIFDNEFVIGTFSEKNIGQKKLYESLKKAGFNVKYKVVSFNDLIDGNIDGLQCDIFFLGHTYVEDLFYYTLMNNTNLRFWFLHFDVIKSLLDRFRVATINDWKEIEYRLKLFMEDEFWLHSLVLSFRKHIVPVNFKNVNLNNDGLIVYKHIVVV
ncbi:SgrR family transcriptional regulator [Macrococcus capreoli]|uniref:SgrR family transcriptional regulator n=1 Tax=Macrococcus capreoli TaxID=2982690 RepID=UPI0021D5E2A0|nr:SgrR family transcriptional regulator [Macrococcus sp. TMW 2.2395]